jgi:hypothetical protein
VALVGLAAMAMSGGKKGGHRRASGGHKRKPAHKRKSTHKRKKRK